MSLRVGSGFDAHRFDQGKTLHLAGLLWPNEPGLAGHSDGDAVMHALVDALLAAAGLGDIGSRFGTDREEYRGARSDVFLRDTVTLLSEQGWRIVNATVQVIGEHPRIGSRREEAEQLLGQLTGASISLSATTTDGMGFTGRGEGIAVYATALIEKAP